MNERKEREIILSKCSSYNDISNYVYLETDELSKMLIEQYQDYVFDVDIDNEKDMKLLELVNKAFEKYISDYNFAKSLRKHLNNYNFKGDNKITRKIMEEVVNFAFIYDEERLKHITNSRWI